MCFHLLFVICVFFNFSYVPVLSLLLALWLLCQHIYTKELN
jgi:hypothetical protein